MGVWLVSSLVVLPPPKIVDCFVCLRASSRHVTSRRQVGSTAPAAKDNGGSGDGDGGADDVEWGMYLRTEEDSDRTKKEWEKEHQAWEDEQVGGWVIIREFILFVEFP